MGRQLTPEHVAAMQAGRLRAQMAKARDAEQRRRDYSSWSKTNAKLWMSWRENCGQSQCGCEWCKPYRASNASMPDMRGVEGETDHDTCQ